MVEELVNKRSDSVVSKDGTLESADSHSSDHLDSSDQGKVRILFVDDDEILAEVGRMMLEHLGYEAECYTDPVKALDAFKSNKDGFGMVITDMSMPEMSGHDLATQIFKISPDLPVIICTGFDIPVNASEYGQTGIRAVVTKPMGMNDFAGIIKEVFAQGNLGLMAK